MTAPASPLETQERPTSVRDVCLGASRQARRTNLQDEITTLERRARWSNDAFDGAVDSGRDRRLHLHCFNYCNYVSGRDLIPHRHRGIDDTAKGCSDVARARRVHPFCHRTIRSDRPVACVDVSRLAIHHEADPTDAHLIGFAHGTQAQQQAHTPIETDRRIIAVWFEPVPKQGRRQDGQVAVSVSLLGLRGRGTREEKTVEGGAPILPFEASGFEW